MNVLLNMKSSYIFAVSFGFLSGNLVDAKETDQISTSSYLETTKGSQVHLNAFADIKVKRLNLKDVTARKACEMLYDSIGKTKGNYSSLVVVDKKGTLITLDLSNVTFVEAVNAISKAAGLSWTIFLYASSKDHPMIGLGSVETMNSFGLHETK